MTAIPQRRTHRTEPLNVWALLVDGQLKGLGRTIEAAERGLVESPAWTIEPWGVHAQVGGKRIHIERWRVRPEH